MYHPAQISKHNLQNSRNIIYKAKKKKAFESIECITQPKSLNTNCKILPRTPLHIPLYLSFSLQIFTSLNIGNLTNLWHLTKTTTWLNLMAAEETLALFYFVFSSACPPRCTSPCPYPPSHRSSLSWQLLLAAREPFPVVSKEGGSPQVQVSNHKLVVVFHHHPLPTTSYWLLTPSPWSS